MDEDNDTRIIPVIISIRLGDNIRSQLRGRRSSGELDFKQDMRERTTEEVDKLK